MSFAIDVNILLYASDASSPFHDRAVTFLEKTAARRELMYLGWTTAMAYLRISTHGAVFEKPLSPAQAMANLDALLRASHVRVLSEVEGFWDVYRSVVSEAPARGAQVSDAHLAALLKQHGIRTLCTNDSDFRRFGFLEVRNPVA